MPDPTLISLAERVEAASGPDRELDALIWAATTPGATRRETGLGWTIDELKDAPGVLVKVPAYTASIDAAMSLVPEGWVWSINTFGDPPKASSYVMNALGEVVRPGRSYLATPALALVAAALRARAAGEVK